MTTTATTATAPRRGGARAPRQPALDAQCADAVELARAAAIELGGAEQVGEHLGVSADDDRVATHAFACLSPAYVGWRWAVTVARASRAKVVTVDETVLLPGDDAVLSPPWVPWSERLRAGDIGVGDVLPTSADDPRLEPGWTGGAPWHQADGEGDLDAGDDDAALGWQLGLGRPRVLSAIGRDDAVDRWYDGDRGPSAPIAVAAPAPCSTCGFLLRLGGSLRRVFGVCANEYASDDGRVVSFDHGCGGHSEAPATALPVVPPHVVDELGYADLDLRDGTDDTDPETTAGASAGEPVLEDESVVEVVTAVEVVSVGADEQEEAALPVALPPAAEQVDDEQAGPADPG